MHRSLLAVVSLLCLAPGAISQTWVYPMNPRAAFLRTNSDAPLPPLVLDLAALGVTPGQWLRIESMGGFRYVSGGQDIYRALCVIFSSSSTLLATSVQHRVPGAVAAGPAYLSGGTYFGSLPIDVPEDFYCSRNGFANGVDVAVPAGATHLFLGVHDSLYNDNADPNGDWGAIVTVLPTPLHPGTGEHLTAKSAVDGGVPAATPAVHSTPPGTTMVLQLEQPLGFLGNELYLVVADVFTTGAPAPHPLPGLWSSNLLYLQFGVVGNAPDWSATWSLQAIAGYPGTTVIVQGAVLTSMARNSLFETTDAHRFEWQ